MSVERSLKRRECAVAGEALDRDELGAVDLRGEEEARAHGDPVEPHRACPADAVLAADVRAGESDAVADEVGQQQPRLDVLAVAATVDGDVDRDHAACSLARATTRSTRTRTTWRRYAGDAWTEPHGSTCSAAECPGRSGSTSSRVGAGVTEPTTTRTPASRTRAAAMQSA